MLALAMVAGQGIGVTEAATQNEVIDFETSGGNGTLISGVATSGGTVDITSSPANRAMIFEATCGGGPAANCTGGDSDLYQPGQGNVLVVSDGNAADPGDITHGGWLQFDFTGVTGGMVDVTEITVIDTETAPTVYFQTSGGVTSAGLPVTANGGIDTWLVGEQDVLGMRIVFGDSGAVDDIKFSYDDGSTPTPTPTSTPTPTPTSTSTPPPPPPPGDPAIRVIKTVDNTGGGTLTPADFTLRVQNQTFPGDEDGTVRVLNHGAFEVTEDEHADYTATFSGDCSGTADDDDFYTCRVNNTYDPEVTPTPTPEVAGLTIGIDNTRITPSPSRPGEPVNFRIDVTLTDVPDETLATVWVQFDPTELRFEEAPEGCALMAVDLIRCDFGNRNADFDFVAEFTGLKVTDSAETNAALGGDFDADGTIDGEAGPAFADGVIIDVEGLQIPPLGDGSVTSATGGADVRTLAVASALLAGLVLAALGARSVVARRSEG
ncbi:MAG: hypothetical protein GEU80_08235 [Dehalococcoidia bacterium]|nr:hypothetical protein [Dehalococcoidia bacterium]